MKKILIFIGMCCSASYSWSDCSGVSCTDVYVEELYIRQSGKNLVKTTGDETKLSCNPDSGVYLEVPETSNKNDMMSVLLAAQMADKKVRFRILENSNCEILYLTLKREE